MTTENTPRRQRHAMSAAVIAAMALLLMPGPVALGTDPEPLDVDAPAVDTRLEQAEAQVLGLRTQLDELAAANSSLTDQNGALEAVNSSLELEIESLAGERDRLQASLVFLEDLYDPLEADRQLLFELRKHAPETRPEAEAQIKRIQRLALSSNPSGLGQLADRLEEAAPAFLEWRFTQFPSADEATQAYVNSRANAFDSTMDEFRNAILFSIANRLDGLLNVLDRVH